MTPAPDDLGPMFDPANGVQGKVSVYDAPIYIADAARRPHDDEARPRGSPTRTRSTTPSSRPRSTCSRSRSPRSASTGATTRSRSRLRVRRRHRRDDLADHHQPAQAETPPVKVDVIKPHGGCDRLVGHLDDHSKTKNPNCTYECMTPHLARGQRPVAEWFGEAPGSRKSCALSRAVDPATATIFHANDDAFWKDVCELETPTDRLRRRPDGHELQGLRRLDQGLDGDQGLGPTVAGTSTARRPPPGVAVVQPSQP